MELTRDQLHSVVEALLPDMRIPSNIPPQKASQAIGINRDNYNPLTNQVNHHNLMYQRHYDEMSGDWERQTEHLAQFTIPKFERAMSEVLEIQWLQVFRLLVTGKYYELLLEKLLDQTLVKLASNVVNDAGDVTESITYQDIQTMPLPDLFRRRQRPFGSATESREYLIRYWKKSSSHACTHLRNTIHFFEPDVLSDATYCSLVTDCILEMIDKNLNRSGYDLLKQHDAIKLTFGLEIEIPPDYTWKVPKQVEQVDSLGNLGIPIKHEPSPATTIREIALPYSSGFRNQILGIVELFRSGIIRHDQQLMLHFTIGSIGEVIDEEIFLLFNSLLMGDIFNFTTRFDYDSPGYTIRSCESEHSTARKPLFSPIQDVQEHSLSTNPAYKIIGLPFLQRSGKEENIPLELRLGAFLGGNPSDFSHNPLTVYKLVKDSSYLAALSYALIGFREFHNGKTSEQNQALAKAWQIYRNQIRRIQHRYCLRAYYFHNKYETFFKNWEVIRSKKAIAHSLDS